MKEELTKIITLALLEDKAFEDITSDLTIAENYEISFAICARQDIILCGIDVIKICFDILKNHQKFKNFNVDFKVFFKDGNFVENKNIIAKGKGNAKLIFAGERIILNLIQHLSAVSTLAYKFKKELNDEKIEILDTRKTTLGLRKLEKYAVLKGGGKNHRFNLSDMILIKDNHIASCDGIYEAVKKAKSNKNLKIEVECDNLKQVKQAVKAKPDIIMLDNMTISQIKKAVQIIKKQCKIEVSGNINLKNIKNYRGLEIDFISIGALTHSAAWVDIGLDVL